MSITVETKEELEKAMKNGEKEIVVIGELAEKLHKSKKVTKFGAPTIAALTAAIAAAPFTGGISTTLGVSAIATLTGLEVAVIIGVVFIGISLLIVLYKDYEEIEVDMDKRRLKLRKKQK
ncbi:hypothetical protein [Aggregatibacter aphrophilus]|uniref:Uncharacterized protein n=1 Tax=Aggregatibacter aphrophilus ATCC 33389 TaxID=985008 RepID=A0A3S5ECX0_AGGAP|nr:hypothetical protein [Aggregatibacter aphrophilus]KNE85343.1 hypothetical protein ATCC33389_0205435 [Aggregatibacter aphrophilus ATCC 33389]OBY54516.1 hypothetical protein BBB51_05195 [Aggregatibacter aphrophilus]RDE88886.1 hypothetical protein DPW00_00870 [Aggregatibacter aphrophilus]VEF44428.1 Uncharacterised protein [Aggregatibacter aphrophilus ATCC 33389]